MKQKYYQDSEVAQMFLEFPHHLVTNGVCRFLNTELEESSSRVVNCSYSFCEKAGSSMY